MRRQFLQRTSGFEWPTDRSWLAIRALIVPPTASPAYHEDFVSIIVGRRCFHRHGDAVRRYAIYCQHQGIVIRRKARHLHIGLADADQSRRQAGKDHRGCLVPDCRSGSRARIGQRRQRRRAAADHRLAYRSLSCEEHLHGGPRHRRVLLRVQAGILVQNRSTAIHQKDPGRRREDGHL